MADGSVIFDTKLDPSGVIRDLSGLATGALKTATAGLAALGTYAVSVGSDFEAAMSNVAATMGTTVDQIGAISDKAKELGATTAFSASQAAEGFNILAQSGLTMEEQLASIDSVLNLAAAGEMQMSDAAGYLTTTIKAFSSSSREANLSMEDSARLADLYAKGATLANTSTAQFGDAMTSAASVAGAYNQSIDTTGTLLLALAEKGYQGSVAGTYLSRAMSDLYAPTENAQKALDELGVSAYDSSGNQRDMIDVVADLEQALSGMTEEEKAAYTAQIFTTAGLKAYNSIAGNTIEELIAMRDNLTDCTGAAQQMADTKLDNLKGDLTILKSATEGFGIAIYENMQNPLRDFVQEGTHLLDELHTAVEEGGLSGLAGAVGNVLAEAVTKVAEYLPALMQGAVDLVRSFIEGISQASPEISGIVAELGVILLDGILTISNDFLEAGARIITDLAASLTEQAPVIFETITSWATNLVEIVGNWLPDLIQATVELIKALAEGIVTNLPIILDQIMDWLPSITKSIIEGYGMFVEAATSIIIKVAESLPSLIGSIIDKLPELIETITTELSLLFPKLVDAGVKLFTSLVQNIPEIVRVIVSKLPELISSITGALLGMSQTIIDAGVQLFTSLVSSLPEIINEIVRVLPEIITAIVDTLTSLIPEIISCGIELLTSIVSDLPQIITAVVAAIPQITASLVDAILDNIPLIIQAGVQLLTALITNLPEIIFTIITSIPEIIAGIVGAITENFGTIAESGQELLSSLVTNLPNIILEIVAVIPEIISAITGAIANFGGEVMDAGYNLLVGMADGIGNALGYVVERACEVGRSIVDGLKNFFGIASPSKLFRDTIGKNLMLGLAEGIISETDEAVDAAQNAADEIAKVDFSPKDSFDLGAADYESLLDTAKGVVQESRRATGKAISGGGAYGGDGKGGGTNANGSADENKPKYVLVENSVDGKVFARQMTPYIEKELDWRDK